MSGEQQTRAERSPGAAGSSPQLPPGMVFISEAELRQYKRLAGWGVGAALGAIVGVLIGLAQGVAALMERLGR